MRIRRCLAICVVCLLYSALCSAQKPPSDCQGRPDNQTFTCDGPNDCHSQIVIDVGGGEGDYYVYTVESRSCCGQLFSDRIPISDCDGEGLLKGKATKDEIERAAKESAVLVADCKGRYVPYRNAASNPDFWPSPASDVPERR